MRLAELYSREKMNSEAVETFRAAGSVLFEERKYDDYIRVAERLLYHEPNDRQTSLQIVNAYLRQQQPRRALMKLNSLLQETPSDREGLTATS